MKDGQIQSSASSNAPSKPTGRRGQASHTANAAGAKGHLIGSTISRSERKANWILYTITAFVFVCITWASFAELDKVTRGVGKVVPSRQVQLVQNLEGGIIRRILVREGEVVDEGASLFILDNTTLKSRYDEGRQRQLALKAKIARLTAQLNKSNLEFPPDVAAEAPQVVSTETLLYAGRKAEMNSQIRFLKGQIEQREQEFQESIVTLETAKNGMVLTENELDIVKPLVESGLEPEINLIKLQRIMSDLNGKKKSSEHAIIRIRAAIQEALDRVAASKEKYKADALAELNNATIDLSRVEQTLPDLRDKVARTELRAPMRSVVNRLLVNTEGGIVRPGEPLAELVPLDDTLAVEANIKPSDIAFLHVGQKVRVKITAYDFAKYGSLDGELTTISADAVQVSDTESAYVIHVRTDASIISYNDEELEIIPGMVAEVNIMTGKQTVMDYILTPILKVKDRAFRE